MKTRLIIGCGYLGKRVALKWQNEGDHVFAVSRNEETATDFKKQGLHPILADVTNANSLTQLPDCDTVLFAVGFDRKSGKSIDEVYVNGLANVLENLPSTIERFIYISSTGVYGDAAGDLVNEEVACSPLRPGGKACLAAEQLLLNKIQEKTIILRLAGIYGPDRIPRSKDLMNQTPLPTPGAGALNLIHVEDAADLVCQVADQAKQQDIYNVSDGHAVARVEYYQELAKLLNAPAPIFSEPEPNSPAALRAASNRRIDNRRLVSDYDFLPRYPSYREGLAAIVANQPSDEQS